MNAIKSFLSIFFPDPAWVDMAATAVAITLCALVVYLIYWAVVCHGIRTLRKWFDV